MEPKGLQTSAAFPNSISASNTKYHTYRVMTYWRGNTHRILVVPICGDFARFCPSQLFNSLILPSKRIANIPQLMDDAL
jgi:hypothetical protein